MMMMMIIIILLLIIMYIYIPRYLLYYTNILFVYISNQLKAKTGRSSKIGHSDSQVTGNPMPYDINAFVTWRFPGFDQRWIIFQSNCSLKLMLSFWGNVTPLNGLPDMVEEFELLSRKTGKWGWIKTYAIFEGMNIHLRTKDPMVQTTRQANLTHKTSVGSRRTWRFVENMRI